MAVKRIIDAFQSRTCALRTFRELVILQGLGGGGDARNRVTGLLDVLPPPPSPSDFKDLFLVLEFKEASLASILSSSQAISSAHVRVFVYQLLHALLFLQCRHIVHRDIKVGIPSLNLLPLGPLSSDLLPSAHHARPVSLALRARHSALISVS